MGGGELGREGRSCPARVRKGCSAPAWPRRDPESPWLGVCCSAGRERAAPAAGAPLTRVTPKPCLSPPGSAGCHQMGRVSTARRAGRWLPGRRHMSQHGQSQRVAASIRGGHDGAARVPGAWSQAANRQRVRGGAEAAPARGPAAQQHLAAGVPAAGSRAVPRPDPADVASRSHAAASPAAAALPGGSAERRPPRWVRPGMLSGWMLALALGLGTSPAPRAYPPSQRAGSGTRPLARGAQRPGEAGAARWLWKMEL